MKDRKEKCYVCGISNDRFESEGKVNLLRLLPCLIFIIIIVIKFFRVLVSIITMIIISIITYTMHFMSSRCLLVITMLLKNKCLTWSDFVCTPVLLLVSQCR